MKKTYNNKNTYTSLIITLFVRRRRRIPFRSVFRNFARHIALDSLVAVTSLLDASGDTLVRPGDVLLQAGASLPSNLETMRQYRQLGITSIAVQGGEDPGDIPKLFTVEVSMGKQAGDTSSKYYRFDVVGRGSSTEGHRRFVFPLEPLDPADRADPVDPVANSRTYF